MTEYVFLEEILEGLLTGPLIMWEPKGGYANKRFLTRVQGHWDLMLPAPRTVINWCSVHPVAGILLEQQEISQMKTLKTMLSLCSI